MNDGWDAICAIGAIVLFIIAMVVMYYCPTIRLIMWILIIACWLGFL